MRFGIIGFGKIARKFVQSIEFTSEGKVTAIASHSVSADDPYLKEHPEVKVFTDYEAMLASGEIDAVYVALPHQLHKEWILRALEHHVAVLSEKPIVLTVPEIEEIRAKVKETKTYCLEALKTRFNDGLIHLKEDLKEIGQLQSIEANFCFDATPIRGKTYLFEPVQGGALNDVGCYLIGFVLSLIDSPIKEVKTEMVLENDIDLYFKSQWLLGDSAQVMIEGAIDRNKERYALIKGSEGQIMVPMFNRVIDYTITKENGQTIEKHYPITGDDMTMEIEAVIQDVKAGKQESDIHSLQDSQVVVELLEKIRETGRL